MHSLNVATVKVAEMIGYQRVVDLARQMGLGTNIQPTPAVALGAYEMTPIDVAAGYTAFADGRHARRAAIHPQRCVGERQGRGNERAADARRARSARRLPDHQPDGGRNQPRHRLSRPPAGFDAPAAGKTGTSRDGWFAGYTSNLLCVVWVGFDDNRDLGLAGGAAAAPIWARVYEARRCAAGVSQHAGLRAAARNRRGTPSIRRAASWPRRLVRRWSRSISSPAASRRSTANFTAGKTRKPAGGGWLAHLFGREQNPPPEPVNTTGQPLNGAQSQRPKSAQVAKPGQKPASGDGETAEEPPKKKGLLDRIFGIFGGSKEPADNSKSKPQE